MENGFYLTLKEKGIITQDEEFYFLKIKLILIPKNKINFKSCGPDEDYGLTEPLIDDISEEDIKTKKNVIIKSLSEVDRSKHT